MLIAAPLLLMLTQTAAHEDIGALETRVVAALGAEVGSPGGPDRPLDRRLRLQRCASPATIDPSRAEVAEVACASAGWRLFVARISDARATDLSLSPVRLAQSATLVVRRGDSVAVRLSGTGFAVTMRAEAEQDGAVGQRIRVRSAARRTPFAVIVTGEGAARLAD